MKKLIIFLIVTCYFVNYKLLSFDNDLYGLSKLIEQHDEMTAEFMPKIKAKLVLDGINFIENDTNFIKFVFEIKVIDTSKYENRTRKEFYQSLSIDTTNPISIYIRIANKGFRYLLYRGEFGRNVRTIEKSEYNSSFSNKILRMPNYRYLNCNYIIYFGLPFSWYITETDILSVWESPYITGDDKYEKLFENVREDMEQRRRMREEAEKNKISE